MQKRATQKLPLFPEESVAEFDEVLQLSKSYLLDCLRTLRSSDSLNGVRNEVNKVKNQMLDPGSRLRSPASNEDELEFTNAHLNSEFDQIAASLTLDRGLYYVERLVKSVTEIRVNEINDINLNRWKEYSDIRLDSLWSIERRDDSGVHSAGYWGNFIPQIPNQMMRRYTKKGDWVLDTFSGSGTTLIEGQRLGRNTIGIELQTEIAERARLAISLEPNSHRVMSDVVVGDSTTIDYPELLRGYGRECVDLVIMHPPYWDIIKFSDHPRDLSNASTREEFLQTIRAVVTNAYKVLAKGRYLILVIGDKYSKGEWMPLGFLTMLEVLDCGLTLKSIVVKNFEETAGKRQQRELWRYRALVGGFYIFKHEYIFIFKKK
jgi:DNA modification methylase